MINIPRIKDIDLYPVSVEGLDGLLSAKYGVLACEIDKKPSLAISEANRADALAFISKIDIRYPIVILDSESFGKLNMRYSELTAQNNVSIDGGDAAELIEEYDKLSEFLQNSTDLLSNEESAPVIKFVNSLFYQAIKKRASDIHIEVKERYGEVRFRIDGTLSKHIEIDKGIVQLVVSRIKVISNLDISEKRVPQDGRTQVKIAGKNLDIRVSVVPTYYGERVVMRILSHTSDIPSIKDLGFNDSIASGLDSLLRNSHGIILVTGPTGSGKSTTLHACLQKLVSPEKNIISVEDPVEYNSDNINQIQVNSKVGLTFASGLRSILRQDPDIIMVGEIRDSETAKIAIQAAMTGHLVLSTLHTNNSTSAVTRLIDMEVENFLIISTLLGVLAQRLVRKLCPHCKQKSIIQDAIADELSIQKQSPIYAACGCKECDNTGYLGRVAVGELFILDDEAKSFIKKAPDDHAVRGYMSSRGMRFLSDELSSLLLNGETSLDEVIRVGIKDG